MSNSTHRTPKSGRQSLFFQDLASPISGRRGRFSTPRQAAAVSSPRKENFEDLDLPPPPMYTLEDRSDFSPESGIPDSPASPEMKSHLRTPANNSGHEFYTLVKGNGLFGAQTPQSTGSSSWWSPSKSDSEHNEKQNKSPEGMVKFSALITLPPPREVARPEISRNNFHAGNNFDEEEWVTVYGFSPSDTNLVLREFEKCGVILKHVPGSRMANCMHILYQNRSDAQKALSKNGMQINGVLIIGVKPLDPMQLQSLNEKLHHQGFMPFSLASTSDINNTKPPSRPYYLQNGNNNAKQSSGAIASPEKSIVSKIVDLMFGV